MKAFSANANRQSVSSALVISPILNMNSILAVSHRWSLGSCLKEAQQFLHCLSKLYLLNSL